LSPEDGEFVSKHDDLRLLEIVRPKAPGRNLPNHYVKRDRKNPPSA
jgi:hypothetical protein